MKHSLWIAAASALLAPSVSYAFPIAVGAAGVGLLGLMALPVLLVAAGAYWVIRNKGKGLIPLLAIAAAVMAFCFLVQDFGKEQAIKAALFTKADSSYLSPPIPFPFVEIEEQAKSPQAVTPAEFVDGLSSGYFKALKISIYPSLFSVSGQVSVDDFWRDKEVLVNAVNRLGGRVVLVDEYGGITASIAGAALRNFGLSVGFLQGGTTALSEHGWHTTDNAVGVDPGIVEVAEYRNWINDHPSAFVMGITTDREFVEDGWVFGDRTLTLADFVSNYNDLVHTILGREVFVVGFETNDTGATPVVVNLLRKAGVEVHYVMPNPDEILIKPPYFDSYANDIRTVSVEDAERYILHRQDVEFLDFSEQPWPIGVDFLKERYHHLPMPDMAKGKLSEFIAGLDPSKVYIGLAFDRRTAYHSLLAGEHLSKRGAPWLGRFTLASSLTEPFLTVEDLNTEEEQAAYAIRDAGATAGYFMLGHGALLAMLAGMFAAVTVLAVNRRRPTLSALTGAVLVAIYACVLQAQADYPQICDAYTAFMVGNGVGASFVLWLALKRSAQRIHPFSNFTAVLPPKAAFLNIAAARGHHVAPGFVLAAQDLPALHTARFGRGRYIVRSATWAEASAHESTAGLFESYQSESPAGIPALASLLFSSFTAAQVDGSALVQRFVKARWYGVIQLQRNESSPLMVCDIGVAEAVTSGAAPTRSFQFPAWDAANSPRLVRKAALALCDLMEIGAYSLEFAITKCGRLIILQVNHSESRACAEKRLINVAKSQVVEVGSAHPDALSAAVVAALSPGQLFAYGQRRFCLVESLWKTRMALRDDLKRLGFSRKSLTARHMIAWVDRYAASIDASAACVADPHSVVAALKQVADTVGRVNRVATVMLAIGKAEEWEVEPRLSPASEVGAQLHHDLAPVWRGLMIGPLTGFGASDPKNDFSADELPESEFRSASPWAWVKDASSQLLSVRLCAIKPAIISLISAGRAQELFNMLESSVGDWDALTARECPGELVQAAQPFAAVLLGHVRSTTCWRVPPAGIEGAIVTPDAVNAGSVLLLDRCSMSYLPLLSQVRAVVVKEGSITSHLMQHAETLGLPAVIGGEIAEGLTAGQLVRIDSCGGVVRA